MISIQDEVQNKENRENKFLSDQIIQKALASGEIKEGSVAELTELFQLVFSEHKGDTTRARAEALMFKFRAYVLNKEQKQKEEVVNEQQKQPDVQVVQIPRPEENDETVYEKEKGLLQRIIKDKIAEADLSEKLCEEANQTIFDETKHIIGTGVGERVFEMSISKALDIFKKKDEIQENKIKEQRKREEEIKNKEEKKLEISKVENLLPVESKLEKNPVSQTSQKEGENKEKIKKEGKEEKTEELEGDEEEDDFSTEEVIEKISTIQMSQDEDEEEVEEGEDEYEYEEVEVKRPRRKKKLSLKQIVLQKAQEDDINNPLKPHTLHWPTSAFSSDISSCEDEPEEKTAVFSKRLKKKKVAGKDMVKTQILNAPKPSDSKKESKDLKIKIFIDDIIKLSEKEINTGNHDADKQFKETLLNSLSFKAKNFVGSDSDYDFIKTVLTEEYEKLKSFYTRSV